MSEVREDQSAAVAAEPASTEGAVVKATGLAEDTLRRLLQAALDARENNASTEFMDEDNRRWFVGCSNVDNRSHVLIQAQRGQDLREAYLSTATFTLDAAEKAVTDLYGALS